MVGFDTEALTPVKIVLLHTNLLPVMVRALPASALDAMLLAHSRGCVWLLGQDGSFQAIRGNAKSVFGRDAAELEGSSFGNLVPATLRPFWGERAERIFSGETLGASARFLEPGPAFFVMLFPVPSAHGEIEFAAGAAQSLPESDALMGTLEPAERTRLSQFMHDGFGQGLTAAGLQLDLLRLDLPEDAVSLRERIGQIQAMLETAMGLLREFQRELCPPAAERVGLRGALDGLAGELRTGFKGNVRLFADATAQPAPEAAAAMFRIAQQAAQRAARRASCSAIEILLKTLRGAYAIEVRDNAPEPPAWSGVFEAEGFEFLVMQRMAERAGLELQVESAPGKITAVRTLCRLDAGAS